MAELLPSLLRGRYQVEALVARGGCGAVYRGVDRQSGAAVAIKQVTAAADDDLLAQAIRREAQTLRRLQHPALPAFIDFFVADGDHFLVMTCVEGDDLARQLARRREPFAVEQVLAWTDQLLELLLYLHGQQPPVIHRDIKPANLKLDAAGRVILLDFGLAKGAASTLHSLPGYTLAYAAPEQVRGEATDGRSDLYSLGATLYHLLTGVKPADALRREAALLTGQPDPLLPAQQVNPRAPAALAHLLQRALALSPAQRFADAAQMRRSLQDLQEEPPTQLVAPPPATATPHNLPAPLSSFIGRARESAELAALLRRDDVRLVTLTGPGGVGKTRLALHTATQLLPDFPQGVFFVSLLQAIEPEQALSVIAQTLGVHAPRGMPLLDALIGWLRSGRRLLLLDNFEHLLEAAPLVTTLLAAAPDLKTLATSRERLRLTGEHVFIVPPLPTPSAEATPSRQQLAGYPAVALFAARACAVWPAFALDDANAVAVAALCRALDGLPLAIELAAARIEHLTPAAMLAQLHRQSAWLNDGPRDVHTRHCSLEAAIGWTYGLLDEPSRALWRHLAVFVGGCHAEALALVACRAAQQAEERLHALTAALLDQHILRPVDGPDGERRYVMLETLRAYGQERLRQHDETDAAMQAMADYCLLLSERAAPALVGPEAAQWLRRLDAEHPNLRAALRWALDQGKGELAMTLCVNLWLHWRARGYLQEGRQWFQQALAAGETVAAPLRGRAYNKAGILAYEQGDVAEAERCETAALLLQGEDDDRWDRVSTLNMLGVIAMERARYTVAERWLSEAVALAQAVGHTANGAHALNNLGVTALRRGYARRAMETFTQSLAAFASLDDRRSVALLRINLGEAMHRLGRPQQALSLLAEARAGWLAFGEPAGAAAAVHAQALIQADLGNCAVARALWYEALETLRKVGADHLSARCLFGLSTLALRQGEQGRCVELLEQAQRLYERLGDTRNLSYIMADWSDAALAHGDYAVAGQRCQEALALAQQAEDDYSLAARFCQQARLALAQADMDAAETHGQRALALQRQVECPAGIALAQCILALVALRNRRLELAQAYGLEALRLFGRLGYRFELARALDACAAIQCAAGQVENAAQLLGAADALRTALAAPRWADEQVRDEDVRAHLRRAGVAPQRIAPERLDDDLAALLAQCGVETNDDD